jgi:signal peptidase I
MLGSSRIKRLIGGAAIGAVALGWFMFAPSQLGGSKSYVLIKGHSMEPRIHTGDLVILDSGSEYRPGVVAGYQSKRLGHAVLHRIVRRSGDRYVFKGDNNDWIDSERPVRSELIGSMWMHIPGAGRYVASLAEPRNAAIFAGVMTLFVGGFASTRARRQRRRPTRPSPQGPVQEETQMHAEKQSEGPLGVAFNAVYVAGAICILFGLLGGYAMTRSTLESVTNGTEYHHRGSFDYRAPSPEGIYDGESISAGDPLFLKLTDRFTVDYSYEFDTQGEAEVAGDVGLAVRVSDDNGWHRTISLGGREALESGAAELSATVDLDKVRSVINRMERATGVANDTYGVDVVSDVDVAGAVDGKLIDEAYASTLHFMIDNLQLQVAAASGEAGVADEDPLVDSGRGSVSSQIQVAKTISLPGVQLDVATARRVGVVGFGAGLLLLAAAGAWAFAIMRRDEPARIAARYGSALVPVHAAALKSATTPIEVESIEGLAKIAEAAARPILHEHRNGVHNYLVEDGGLLYRYQMRTEDATSGPTPTPSSDDGEAIAAINAAVRGGQRNVG